jgi:RNA polymerase sigma factor (sigma-70 family)
MTNFEANDLIDVYGNLLTERQLEILQLYYQEDLSLSEIHEELDISRAAIQQTIKKSMQQLEI